MGFMMNKNLYVSDALRLERERSELLAWKLSKANSLNVLQGCCIAYLFGLIGFIYWSNGI
jgi:hypothetical protein